MSLTTLKRRVGRGLSNSGLSNSKTALKSFDAYPKTIDDFAVKTSAGGLISLFSMVCIALLFLGELNHYLTTKVQDRLIIDTTLSQRLKIELDVTMHHLPCSQLGVDVMDVSGESQHEVSDNITKQRLDKNGNYISADVNDGAGLSVDGLPEQDMLDRALQRRNRGMQHAKLILPDDYCGSCYGAETEEMKCCNTCDEAQQAIKDAGIYVPDNIEQCVREGKEDHLEAGWDEGCRVRGYVEVKKVAGNIHIAPGHSAETGRAHVHDIRRFPVEKFNSSFTVHRLQFGNSYPGLINPLDGTSRVAQQGSTMFQHFLKMVPTVYEKLDGENIETNQFSYTVHERVIDVAGGDGGLPGVFFNLEMSAIKVVMTEERRSLARFLTSVCAIVGGVFTVAGLVDATIYRSSRAIQSAQNNKAN
ncbi:hypothetical protein SARC_06349 [Sphaeroforma arctica JP610]|uniref:Endoplasmic reticulum-Golgi intermediate compartment protein 3 n=1 Tax=Sphaeroforma arctica JP610 TaxID=667725 RepID=A0A0L0FXN7_9EUKA|nr:hypothetical protein SARC_06349 [Sphaeroforma arctica JP610]KNC81331.1 hypothetical protein SARC_06349 [Sphaeroforma arctica JP610]|eukprot:XP_014155233.1 hypothetical protein SARC_06349 [Sphaeroforma arctica JP610]